MEKEFENVPMFLATLRGLPKVHDYRAVEYDITSGEQLLEANEEEGDLLAELNYRLELEKGLLGQIGRTQEVHDIDAMIVAINRRFMQDPSTRGMLKVTDASEVEKHWQREIAFQKEEGARQIEKLKKDHEHALREKQAAIRKEKSWLDGEDWTGELGKMRRKMQESSKQSHRLLDGLIEQKVQTIEHNKKAKFRMRQSQSAAQVHRAEIVAKRREDLVVSRRQVKGQYRVTDRSKDEEEIRQLTTEHEIDHRREREKLVELKVRHDRKEQELSATMFRVKEDGKAEKASLREHARDLQGHLQLQRGIGRRVEKMENQADRQKQQQEREGVVAQERLHHKIHCLEHRLKRDKEKLELKGEVFLDLPSMMLDKNGLLPPPV